MTRPTLIEQSARVQGLQQRIEEKNRALGDAADVIRAQRRFRRELLEVESAGFILRLKWLFTGINK